MEWIIFKSCLRSVLTKPLIRAKYSAPIEVLNPPDIFCLHLTMRTQSGHASSVCVTTWSAWTTCLSVVPLWPFWPPLGCFPCSLNELVRTGFFSPSLDGGFELLLLSLFKRRFNSAISAACWATIFSSSAILANSVRIPHFASRHIFRLVEAKVMRAAQFICE